MTRNRNIGGFTLIEIMVGLVIGLIASIIIFQVFAFSERQKRTTTGVSDAQTNAAVSMRLIERDMQMAGWGAESKSFGACTTIFSYLDSGSGSPGPIPGLNNLTPSVTIVDGGASGSDTITASYFDSPGNLDFKFALTTLEFPQSTQDERLRVASTYGCVADNVMLVKERYGGNCTVMQISSVDSPNKELHHEPTATPTLNPPLAYMTTNGWPKYTTADIVQCLQLPKTFRGLFYRTYQTGGGKLSLVESQSTGAGQTLEIASDIVDLQAEYGISLAGQQDVSSWVPATGIWAGTLTSASLARIKAVRVAIVARGEFEKPDDAGNCSATTASMATTWSTWATFAPTNYGTQWDCYRYKVFETVIPLRNLIWAKL
jgi:type IV pilus assembly protein PilW